MLTVDSFCRRVFAPRPTDMILYYLFIILSAKGSFCRMFQRFGYPTEVINAMSVSYTHLTLPTN